MTLLSWKTGLFFAGIVIPLLLLLYFLKLRRQERKVSSTYLWKKAVQDLQVNAPFQKLRRNLLLLLQLLLLASVLMGLSEPVANFMRRPEKNIVILLDRSASMKTVERDGRTRLEHAQEAAAQFVQALPDNSNTMVIGFGATPSVVSTFTDDKRRLERLIRDLEPTDEPGRIGEALPLAIAYSSNLIDIPGVEGSTVPEGATQGIADIELFSDGRIGDTDQQFITRGQLRYFRVGAESDNVGITAFDVRRDFERPGSLAVFVRVENFGPVPVKTDLSILLDGRRLPGAGSIREVQLGAAAPPTTTGPADAGLPSAQNVIFEFQHEAGGVIEVRLHREDAFAVDNVVWAPVDPPRELRVLAVCDRAPIQRVLRKAMVESFDVREYQTMGREEYEKGADDKLILGGRSAYDLVVLDDHDTNRLPPGNYLFFGGVPKIDDVSIGDEVAGDPIIFARQDHPLMRHVAYEGLFIARWRALQLPKHAVSLLEGPDTVAMAMLTDPGHRYVIASFDLLDSNFTLKEAFPMFLQNALGYLASGGLLEARRMMRPGDTFTMNVPADAKKVKIERPDGSIDEEPVRAGGLLSYARTREAGVYRVQFDDPARTKEVFAANLLDPIESSIAPNESFTVGTEAVESVLAETKINRPLWPYAVMAGLCILLIEWWIYNKRVMI